MTIHGSPWDKIKQVEQNTTSEVARLDSLLVELNAQLRALDQRFTAYFEEREKESKSVSRRKAVQKKAAS